MEKRSIIWEYFVELPPPNDGAQCLSCKKIITSKSKARPNTSNLKSHLRVHHPLKHYELTKRQEITSPGTSGREGGDEEDPVVVESQVDDPSAETLDQFTPPSPSNVLSKQTKQTTLSSAFKPLSKSQITSFNSAIAYWLAIDMEPYQAVEKPGFLHLMATVAPLYSVPGRRYFSDSRIPSLYDRTKGAIKGILAEADFVSLTTDCWSSATLHPYISLTAHFINKEWQLESACLNCCSLDVDHTAANLKDALLACTDTWNIRQASIAACTTDNGANIIKAVDLLHWDHVSCFGHSMNTGASNALSLPMIRASLGRVNKIRSLLHFSSKLKRELREAQTTLEVRCRSIPASCPTRWWSVLEMCEVAVEQSKAINAVLMKYSKHAYLCLQLKEVRLMEEIVKTMAPLRDISTYLSGDLYVTASALWPLYCQIKKAVQFSKENPPTEPAHSPNDDDDDDETPCSAATVVRQPLEEHSNTFFTQQCEESDDKRLSWELHLVVESMHDAIIKALDKRYMYDRNIPRIGIAKELLQLATFLDPRFKGNFFESEDLCSVKARLISEMLDKDSRPSNGDEAMEPPAAKVSKPNKMSLGALFKKLQAQTQDNDGPSPALSKRDQLESEVNRFIHLPVTDMEDDPLIWWKNHQIPLPHLAGLAKKYLCIQGSSVPSERVFSCGGNVVTDHRTNLSPEHAEQLVFLSMNKKRVPKI